MKKIFSFSFVFLTALFLGSFFTNTILAQESQTEPEIIIEEPAPEPEPEEPEPDPVPSVMVIEENVILQNSCEVQDTNGTIHTFPQENSPSKFLAICALAMAHQAGYIENFTLSYFEGFGLFVDSINDIKSTSAYWALWYNGAYSEEKGLVDLPLSDGDSMALVFTTFDNDETGDKVTLHITLAVEDEPENGGGGNGGGENNNDDEKTEFDIQKALDYLKSVQYEDGSFEDSVLYTDWAGIAFGAMNVGSSFKTKILSYFNSNNEISSLITENERRAMAILALDKNPYSFGEDEINYIEAIIDEFDGEQFGDADLVNDDIFALIPLKNAGYDEDDDVITKDIDFVISEQKNNGSWEESVDVTAAAVQALSVFSSVSGVSEVLSQASAYLANEQNTDGGWGNVSSTSWAIQAESALDESWANNGKNGLDYLAIQQTEDGAISPTSETLENRIWMTSYAIAAASGKSWSEIMESFSRPKNQENSQNNSPDNSNDSETGEVLGITDNQTPIPSVVCPEGDLFSATTGQACTEFTPKVTTTPKTQKPKTIVSQDLPTNINIIEEKPDTQTATVVDALPKEETSEKSSHTTPIVLGIVSGIVLLYFVVKFLIK